MARLPFELTIKEHNVAPFIVLACFGIAVGFYMGSVGAGFVAYLGATVWREGR